MLGFSSAPSLPQSAWTGKMFLEVISALASNTPQERNCICLPRENACNVISTVPEKLGCPAGQGATGLPSRDLPSESET